MKSRNARALATEKQSLLSTNARLMNEIKNVEIQLSNRTPNAITTSTKKDFFSSTTTLWLFSGLINGLLKIIFCNVFATLMYDAAPHLLKDSFLILVGTQLSSSFLTNLFTARKSQLGSSISGPDIVHALFLATMVETIATKTNDPAVAAATILFLICFTNLCVAVTWLFVAKYNLMIVIDFFPVGKFSVFCASSFSYLTPSLFRLYPSLFVYSRSGHDWIPRLCWLQSLKECH
jgi:hypothetical protein